MMLDKDLRELMERIRAAARESMNSDRGGPFGAAVVDSGGKVLAIASNTVLSDCDPTAHAEINAIRAASHKLASYDLSGCTLLTTCYPCPMCLAAALWAGIAKVVYGCRPEDADAIGFRDGFIYDFIKDGCRDQGILELEEADREKCLALFVEYRLLDKTIY